MSRSTGKKKQKEQDYQDALRDYFNGIGGVSELSKKYNINRTAFHKAIKRQEELKNDVVDIKHSLYNGMSKLDKLKKSEDPLANLMADDILDSLKTARFECYRQIHDIGRQLLNDLHNITESKRNLEGYLEIKDIGESFKALKMANDVIGVPIPSAPIVNIQNNNANINNINGVNNNVDSENNHKIQIEFVEAKKDDDYKEIIDCEVIND